MAKKITKKTAVKRAPQDPARKPLKLDEIVGQDAARAALRRAIAQGGGAGSTLILGPEGIGRFKLALAAAREILDSGSSHEPATVSDGPSTGSNRAGALVDGGRHPDLMILEPDEGIGGVRTAISLLQRKPALAPRQVLIVRDADRMARAAHDALLKTLEEPPAGAAVFVVAADETLLPDTVVSRCRRVRARALDVAETVAVLEKIGVPTVLARFAPGAPGQVLYLHETGGATDAELLVTTLRRPPPDPIGALTPLTRRRKGEDSKGHRRRLAAVLGAAASELRGALPGSESVLRCVVDALGSLSANANPSIVLADLALWKLRTNPPTHR